MKDMKKKEDWARFLLRISLAFVFIYVAIAAFITPFNWIGFIPSFITDKITRAYVLHFHSFFNIILGMWLLSGWKTFYAAIVSCIALFGIIIFNLGAFDIIFRDVAILLSAVVLAFLSFERGR